MRGKMIEKKKRNKKGKYEASIGRKRERKKKESKRMSVRNKVLTE